jgi:hypothetical protein
VALAGVAAVLAVAVVRNPGWELFRDTQMNLDAWNDHTDDDYEAAMNWIATETPTDAQVLAPPYEDDVLWLAQRGVFVSWKAIPYDRMDEWIARLERLGVDEVEIEPDDWITAYAGLKASEVRSIVSDYDIDYVVTMTDYDFPVETTFGDWTVYSTGG